MAGLMVLKNFSIEIMAQTYRVCLSLFKIMIPITLLVKLLEEFGLSEGLGQLIAPVMAWVGLPEAMGLVWAATIVGNIYAGMLLLANSQESLTVAQVTVLGGMMLLAHGLPVEVAIARKVGVGIVISLFVRVGGGLLFGFLLFKVYAFMDYGNEPAQWLWQPEGLVEPSWWVWAVSQLQSFAAIVLIVAVLLATLKILRLLGVERLMAFLLTPALRFLGIGHQAMSLTIVGITLGLAFGGGLLIEEVKQGRVSPREVFITIMMLSLLHSLIEDTLLILLLGADFNGIFWGRLVFALLFVGLIARVLVFVPEKWQRRGLYRAVNE